VKNVDAIKLSMSYQDITDGKDTQKQEEKKKEPILGQFVLNAVTNG